MLIGYTITYLMFSTEEIMLIPVDFTTHSLPLVFLTTSDVLSSRIS